MYPLCATKLTFIITSAHNLLKISRELNAELTLTSFTSSSSEKQPDGGRNLQNEIPHLSLCSTGKSPWDFVGRYRMPLRLSWLLNAISLAYGTASVHNASHVSQCYINQLHSQPMLKKPFSFYLPINVLLQADGTVRGGAATECVQCSTATFPVALTFGLKLPGLHFFQCLHCKPVHGILQQKKGKKKAMLLQ